MRIARLVLLAGLLASCGAQPPAPERRSIVLITIDTLRRDHCSLYGYFRATTPRIDEWAREAVVFEQALAPMATTLPSHLSMLTGLYPHQHGVTSNLAAAHKAFESADGRRSVAELLRDEGYTTAAFVSGRTLHSATGVGAGFERYDAPEADECSAEQTAARALEWLAGEHREPFFLWVHFWGPHEPNLPPPPFDTAFADSPELDALLAERRVDPHAFSGVDEPYVVARNLYPELLDGRGGLTRTPPAPDLDAFRRLYRMYDGEVLYTDHWIGELLDALARLDIADDAVVALTADHGQGLGQHGWLDHGEVTQENLRVPLAIRFARAGGIAPRRLDRLVSSIDLMPTVLRRACPPAYERLAAQATGRDALADGAPHEFVLAQRTTRDRRQFQAQSKHAVITERWKLLVVDGRAAQLYDLRADPGELVDVSAEHPDVVRSLARAARELPSARESDASPEVDAEQREALRRLGYFDDR